MSEHTITLRLDQATTEQLRRALSDARKAALDCERQGYLHTWTVRADAIEAVLAARSAAALSSPETDR